MYFFILIPNDINNFMFNLMLSHNVVTAISDFIWPFLTPNIGVIPNKKTGCIFPIFVSIFPKKLFFFFVFAFFTLDRVIAQLVPLQAARAS